MSTAVAEKGICTRELKLASRAITIQAKINALNEALDIVKDELRGAASGGTKTIIVPDKGKVHIAKASEKTTTIVLSVDEVKLAENAALRQKMLDKGIIVQKTKTTGGGIPAVTIKPNV